MKTKVVAFCPADNKNLDNFKRLEKSFHKFHPKIELMLIGEEQVKKTGDPNFYYRATPVVGRTLLDKFDVVIKLDADQIITGDLSHTWEGEFDVGVVNNSNPRELKKLEVKVWNIHPLSYANCGFVVMKSKKFVNHWYNLCNSVHFNFYQYKEQDLLNIMVFYGDWQTKFLDAGKNWHGLISKLYEPQMIVKNNELILPKNEEWGNEDKTIKVIHFAGGNTNKGNIKLLFNKKTLKFVEGLVK